MTVEQASATSPPAFRAGFVSIIGRPNVGKSTLMNRLLGQKVSIVSPKAQTTRNRILGVKTLAPGQLIFLDTPGIHRSQALFNREMVRAALRTIEEADLVLWLLDAAAPETEDDRLIAERLGPVKTPLVVGINKVDLVEKAMLLPVMDRLHQQFPTAEIVPISATAGDNLDRLERLLLDALPEGPALYPEDQLTDQPERFIIGELIREQVFHLVHQEVPYSVAVEVDSVREREGRGLTEVAATIYVEKDSQKAIIIGAGGALLKKIGARARREIEALLGTRIFLSLWVKVKRSWRKDEAALRQLGYLQE